MGLLKRISQNIDWKLTSVLTAVPLVRELVFGLFSPHIAFGTIRDYLHTGFEMILMSAIGIAISNIQFKHKKTIELNEQLQNEISLRKKTETSLMESKEKLRLVTDNLPVLISYVDSKLQYQFVNKAHESWFGLSRKEIIGKHIKKILGKENLEKITEKIEVALSGKPIVHETIQSYENNLTRYVSLIVIPHIEKEDGAVKGLYMLVSDITERKQIEEERKKIISELQEALAKVKTLRGLLPICASCKKIRDDKGYWNRIENYIKDHSEAVFTHGICPECAKELYPKLDLQKDDF